MAIKTEEQFIEVVKKAEEDAERSINTYKIRLALFAAIGYVVIFAVLFLLLGLVGGMIAIALLSSTFLILLIKKKIIFVVLLAIWTFLKALWIKFDKPEGFELTRKDYPALYDEIDRLTEELRALHIHQVILNGQLNAAVIQHPKFGILGGQQNTLFLGLELLLALSPEEMRSILAHEFGHLSGNHSRFSGWIYRVRVSWDRVMQSFSSSDSFGALMMKRFFDWYAPYFSAYSFALARNNEYEADAVSAELLSPSVAVSALVNVHALAPYIDEKYWSSYFEKAAEIPEPPHNPYEGLADFLRRTPISREELTKRVDQALADETHYADTHPSLNDRVKALGEDVVLPEPVQTNAAQAWLGTRYTEVLAHFDHLWMKDNKKKWVNRYDYVKHAKQSLKEYAGKKLSDLDDDALWDYALWSYEFESDESALPLYRTYQSRHEESIGASYYIGRILIAREDEESLRHLRIAFQSPSTIREAASWGYNYLIDRNRKEEAEQWWSDASAADEIHQQAEEERNTATLDDSYLNPNIDDSLLEQIKRILTAQKNIGSVWLAQKLVKHYPDQPVYIIAFKPKGFFISDNSLMKSLTLAMKTENDIFIVSSRGETKKLAKKVKERGIQIL